jgi:hypothetical protein
MGRVHRCSDLSGFLRAAGWALVINEPVTPADIIVVWPDSGGGGALEAGTTRRYHGASIGEDHEPKAPYEECERTANSPN